jgi:hypothetical protein
MKLLVKFIFLLVIVPPLGAFVYSLLSSPDEKSQMQAPALPKVAEWAYAVPYQGFSTVNVWKQAGAKKQPGAQHTLANEIIAVISEPTRVGIVARPYRSSYLKTLANDSIYFHVELEDGTRGFVESNFIFRDIYGRIFYERNAATGAILRDGKGYSYSYGENCILHTAAAPLADLTKNEFETSEEFAKRRSDFISTIPWFKSGITYTYTYAVTGEYNADSQVFEYFFTTDKFEDREKPGLRFDNDCTDEFGYRLVELETDVREYRQAKTLLSIARVTLPKWSRAQGGFEVRKSIARADAPRFKYAKLFVGVRPETLLSASRGSNNRRWSGPSDHRTGLGGDVSYMFLITDDGKDVIDSYVSETYTKTWQRDLQSQLVIAGYGGEMIDDFASDSTKEALESAVKDGILPNSEVSMRSTMLLIEHNRKSE